MDQQALEAFKAADFNWTSPLDSVWEPPSYHSPALHRSEKQVLMDELMRLQRQQTGNPLGQVVAGSPGSGKTQLLTELRQHTRTQSAFFVLVDMIDVRDFWETVLLGYLDSLLRQDQDGLRQFDKVLWHLFTRVLPLKPAAGRSLGFIAKLGAEHLRGLIDRALVHLAKRYRKQTHDYQDVIRALILLASEDFMLSDIGYTWLQGLDVDAEARSRVGLRKAAGDPHETIRGLSWLMGLAGPTVLAFDQLDAIVSEHNLVAGIRDEMELEDSQRRSLAIIEGIAGGLMALWDITDRTLLVVSCTDNTWNTLEQRALKSSTDRFRRPLHLGRLPDRHIAEEIIVNRLATAYRVHDFKPPYPSYPFKTVAFDQVTDYFPRDLLKACDRHQETCKRNGQILELESFFQDQTDHIAHEEGELSRLDARFEQLKAEANPAEMLTQEADDALLADILPLACQALLREVQLADSVDVVVDQDFNYKGNYPPLHARIRLIYREEGDRERHFAFRALQKSHHIAFQSRLKAAMTASGIDRQLTFRRLLILRSTPLPGGPITAKRVQAFKQAGGILYRPNDEELRTLWAIARLVQENPVGLTAWLRRRRPASHLAMMQKIGLGDLSEPPSTTPPNETAQPASSTPKPPDGPPKSEHSMDIDRMRLPIGRKLIGSLTHQPVTIPLNTLPRHTVILASAGSGKTVLVRRVVEEAALRGIPSLVIDAANDLSRLGEPWPTPPDTWSPDDHQLAAEYFGKTETIIWTPGVAKGNPLQLEPLPDLAAVADSPDELQQAVALALGALTDIVAPGNSDKAKRKQGVLASALDYFARQGDQGLDAFIDLMSDLPMDAGGGISNAPKLAAEMADQLKSERLTNVLWRQQGTRLDPAILIGPQGESRTRISVLNLSGLPSLENQQQFMAQLGMTLFTWIKRHPAPAAQSLRGLLVIDEAKDFVPAGRTVSCKDALLRLAAQARKYGLGLIFASQAPKSIDHNVVANCTTQIYGRANSPVAISTVKDLLTQKGGSGKDIATLEKGQFYVHGEGFAAPVKVLAPMCLSHHAATPPTPEEVQEWAAQSRRRFGG